MARILNPWILDDVSDAANMNRRSLLSDWEGLRGREQTPSPRPPSKRSRCNSLPPSTTPRKGDHQSRSSSSPPSPDRTKGHLIPMAVFWDIENCRVPEHAEDISKNIRTALQMNHDVDSAAAVIGAYGAVGAKTRKLLERNGIKHFGISKKEKKKDAADKMIWADMFQFASNHPAPAYILLITGDADFASTARFLVQCGYTIVIALPEEGKTASELFTAGNYAWDWTSLAMGKGIVTRSLQADLDSLKTEMIQLHTSKGGYIDSGDIHSEYTKKFRKQIKLSNYKAEKMVDLFKMMGDPFIITGEKTVFLDSQSSQCTTSVTAFQAHPPASVAEDSSVDTERKKEPCYPNEEVICEAMIEYATPSVRRSRWDEMPDADVTPEAAGASLGVTPSGTWDATPKFGCVMPTPGGLDATPASSNFSVCAQVEYHAEAQSLKEDLEKANSRLLSMEEEHKREIEQLNHSSEMKINALENKLSHALVQQARDEAATKQLKSELSSHKAHIDMLGSRLEQVTADVHLQYKNDIQDLRDVISVEQEEKKDMHRKLQNAENELMITRMKQAEQQRDSVSVQHVDTLK